MKIITFINSLISFFNDLISFGRKELKSSITIRSELEDELSLRKVSILISKLEQVEELELPDADKAHLKSIIQAKIIALTAEPAKLKAA